LIDWRRSPAVRLLGLLALAALLVWAVIALRGVITPFAVAFAFAYFLNPPVNAMEHWFGRLLPARVQKVAHPRTLAVGVLCILVVAVLVVVMVIAVPATYHQVSETIIKFPNYAATLRAKFEPTMQRLAVRYPEQAQAIRDQAENAVREHGIAVIGRATGFVQKTLFNILDVAVGAFNLVVVPIFAVYLLFDMNHIWVEAAELVPMRFRAYVYTRFAEVDRLLSAFVRGQVTVCLMLGTFYAIALTICGVPMGLLVGMVVGFFNMIPYMSTVVGLPLTVTLSLIDKQSLHSALVVAAIFVFGQFVEANFVTPRIVGHGLGLHAIVIMLAVLVGASLFGFMGMLIAVPTTAGLSVFWADLKAMYLRSEFFRGGAGEAPPPAVP
jgi:predicted PurR-regulated permease PerM